MTQRERFIAALERRPIEGLVPHFELVFYLTMEAFGKVHPTHRVFSQWKQMSREEQAAQITDIAQTYIEIARRYGHSAIFVQSDIADYDTTRRILTRIRDLSGDEYFIMLHGDPTFSIPDGDSMMDFTVQIYEEPEKLLAEAEKRVETFTASAARYRGAGLIDGFALCSDYAFNKNPFFNPEQFDKFVVPYLKEIISRYHEMGYYVIKHTDGNIRPILGQIVACGPDAIHSIDPQGGMDLAAVKREYGDRVCAIGNVNCALLQTGTDEECIADVRRSLREGMEGWGYIFSTSNCVYTGMSLKRYELMLRVWREYGNYSAR